MKHLLALVIVVAATSTARADSHLYDDQYLFPGQKLVAPSCYYELTFQADGNLVLTGPGGMTPFWASGTNGRGAGYAVVQSDGNFVIYTWGGTPLWSTGTYRDQFADLALQDDGNLVVYEGTTPVWASDTVRGPEEWRTCSQSSVTDFRANTNMAGGDYAGFDIGAPQPLWCSYYCAEDTRCQAYTYVPPGLQGPNAKCWLKSSQPSQSYYPGMVSGLIIH